MLRDLSEFTRLRADVVNEHRDWKRRSLTLDAILSDRWQTVWDDLTTEIGEPLVENTALQAIEDKVAQAASVNPRISVPPTRGTRSDRAERVAEQRRRVMRSYWDRSLFDTMKYDLFYDRIGHGAAYLMPWCDLYDLNGRIVTPERRFPYLLRINPRMAYPISHNSNGRLTSIIFTRIRHWRDLELEYGENHPGLLNARNRWDRTVRDRQKLTQVEESWYYDETDWAVALTLRPAVGQSNYYQHYTNYDANMTAGSTSRIDEWLIAPSSHGMDWCPVAEGRRVTFDGQYRGEIESMIPRLKVAQNIMARYLDDLADSVYGPVIMEGLINPEDYGPGAELIGDGSGTARVEFPRKPIGFEARQAVLDQLSMARRQAAFPEQRSGEAGASIITGRGTQALMGTYNTALAAAQSDISSLLQWATALAAHYDERHGAARKTIEGVDGGMPYIETYDPATLFKGDYRVKVSYGPAAGLDRQNFLMQLALGRNLQVVSRRTLMHDSGLVDDPLQEERDMLIEDVSEAMRGFLFSQAQAGNLDPLRRLLEKTDGDAMTVRQAMVETVKEMEAVPAEGPNGTPGPAPDMLRQMASMGAGGSGTAEGLTDAGRSLRRVLPPRIAANLGE